MIRLLVWIVIIIGIAKARAKKNASSSETKANTSDRGNYSQVQNKERNFAEITETKKVPPNVERNCSAEDRHRSENNVYHKRPSQQTTVPNVKRDYTETVTPTRTEKQATRMVAKRLYEGDQPPRGYRVQKCGYCAAENLIAYSARGKYMCYFCHEDL